jgi:hypothetical protein
MAEGETMLLAGEAGGSIDGESWPTPAAWKALFADNKPVYEIVAKRRPPASFVKGYDETRVKHDDA